MPKYIIEENINFYDELSKMLNNDNDNNDDESKVCQITGLPLTDKAVTLECKHHFNYISLYKEICRQKYDFRTYIFDTLNKNDRIKVRDANADYFIRCPYCRNIQLTILPYYEELGLKFKYGINTLDKKLDSDGNNNCNSKVIYYGSDDYTFYLYGKLFKKGQCSFKIGTISPQALCNAKYTTPIENSDLSYCSCHYKTGIKNYKDAEKQKKLDLKLANKKQQEDLLEEKNKERIAKGLKPLKRMPLNKPKVKNVIEQVQHIGEYIPENDDKEEVCNSILKTGPNKGSKCGCKKIYKNGLCKRHSSKDEIKEELDVNSIKNDL